MRKALGLLVFTALMFTSASGSAGAQEDWRITPQNLASVKEKAAAGDPYYQAILGQAYLDGEVVLEDEEEGFKWTKLAAGKKNPIALCQLGVIYEYGQGGVEKDEEKAKELYAQAEKDLLRMAKKGDPRAQLLVYTQRRTDRGYKNMTESEATEWRNKAADQGYSAAQFVCGVYKQSENLPEAVELFTKAAEQDYVWAQTQLASAYDGGLLIDDRKGVPIDLEKALYWNSRLAARGGGWGQVRLARMYQEGKGVPEDKRKALRLYYQGMSKLDEREKKYEIYKMNDLDRETGLLLPIRIKWAGVKTSPDKREIEEKMDRVVKAHNAGMTDVYLEILNGVIDSNDSIYLYRDNYWYVFHRNNMPPVITSKMLQFVKYYNPAMKNDVGFWFDYSHNANLAGQPGLSIAGVGKLREAAGKSFRNKKETEQWAAILEANALIQLGKEKEAYDLLYKAGQLDPEDTWTVNYINHWARPLLKDKKKLAFVTGVDEVKWTGKYELPEPRPFHDMETGKLIKPLTKAPKLETKAAPKPEEKPEKKKIKFMVME